MLSHCWWWILWKSNKPLPLTATSVSFISGIYGRGEKLRRLKWKAISTVWGEVGWQIGTGSRLSLRKPKIDQFKRSPSMVTIDFFLLGASEVWNFVGPKMSSFEQIWKAFSKTVIISHNKSVQKSNFGFYLITGNYTNKFRLKGCQKSNISEKIW